MTKFYVLDTNFIKLLVKITIHTEAAVFAEKVFFFSRTFLIIFIEHLQNFQEV